MSDDRKSPLLKSAGSYATNPPALVNPITPHNLSLQFGSSGGAVGGGAAAESSPLLPPRAEACLCACCLPAACSACCLLVDANHPAAAFTAFALSGGGGGGGTVAAAPPGSGGGGGVSASLTDMQTPSPYTAATHAAHAEAAAAQRPPNLCVSYSVVALLVGVLGVCATAELTLRKVVATNLYNYRWFVTQLLTLCTLIVCGAVTVWRRREIRRSFRLLRVKSLPTKSFLYIASLDALHSVCLFVPIGVLPGPMGVAITQIIVPLNLLARVAFAANNASSPPNRYAAMCVRTRDCVCPLRCCRCAMLFQ